MDSLLEKLTIVIPTYERSQFALRQIEYWSGSGCNIIILDGSRAGLSAEALKNKDGVKYVHKNTSFLNRLHLAVSMVDTPYVALLADDDLFFKTGVNRCINFLEGHPMYTTAFGRTIAFELSDKSEVKAFPAYLEMKGYAVEQDDPARRLMYHFENYTPSMMYGISRIDAWKSAINFQATAQFPFFAQAEVQIQMCLAVQGKSVVLDCPVWIRSREEPSLAAASDIKRDPGLDIDMPFNKFWRDSKASTQKERFLSTAVEHFAESLGLSDQENRYLISNACDSLCDSLPRNFTLKQKKINLLIMIKTNRVGSWIVRVYRTLKSSKSSSLADQIIEFSDYDQNKGLNEARQITSFLRAWHIKTSGNS